MATEMLLNAINFLCSEVHLMHINGDIIQIYKLLPYRITYVTGDDTNWNVDQCGQGTKKASFLQPELQNVFEVCWNIQMHINKCEKVGKGV